MWAIVNDLCCIVAQLDRSNRVKAEKRPMPDSDDDDDDEPLISR